MDAEVKPNDTEPSRDDNGEKVDSENPSPVETAAASAVAAEEEQEGNSTTQDSSITNGDDNAEGGEREMVDLKIIWNKIKYDLKIPLDSTGAKLKEAIHSLTGK